MLQASTTEPIFYGTLIELLSAAIPGANTVTFSWRSKNGCEFLGGSLRSGQSVLARAGMVFTVTSAASA